MKTTSSALLNVFLVVVLVSSIFLVGITSSIGEYDPWMDTNDDGRIDMRDIGNLARMYGAEGTPINKTEMLLELQERLDALNATVLTLEEQIALLGGACAVEVGEFDGEVNSDIVEKEAVTTINFETSFTSIDPPEMFVIVVLKGPADGLVEGAAIKAVESIKGSAGNWTGFDLTVSKYIDGSSISDATRVFVSWMAVGTESTGTLVVAGSIPYDANGVYDIVIGLSQDVSGLIPPGFTLVAAVATGYKAHQVTGIRQEEPPLILEPKVSGTVFQTRVWDASGNEYGGSNWSTMTAHIDYTLFLTA